MKDMLYAAYVLCPHGHARVTAIDTSAAEKMKGVAAVHVVAPAGTEVQWHGKEIAAVAATTEEAAREAVRKIKVDYEVMPHFVNEADLGKAGARGKAAGEKVTGDPEKAFQEAEAVSDGVYGIPVITHCCLEPHGTVIQWQGDQVMAWPSTQFVTGWANTLATNLKVPAANIKVKMDYIGGGFGSKFGPGAWAEVGAILSQKAGGKPVKIYLDRVAEQTIAGNRPSAFGKIKVAGKKDGTITAWQSDTWASGGLPGGGQPPLPYVYTNIPNTRLNHTSVSVNAGPEPGMARAQQSAGLLPDLLRHRGFRRQGRLRPDGCLPQERRLHAARRAVSVPARKGRRAFRMEEAVEAARPEDRRRAPRPRHRRQRMERQRPRLPGAHHASTPMARCCSKWARRISAPAPAPS